MNCVFEMAQLATMMHTRALDLLKAVDTASAGLYLGDRPCKSSVFLQKPLLPQLCDCAWARAT